MLAIASSAEVKLELKAAGTGNGASDSLIQLTHKNLTKNIIIIFKLNWIKMFSIEMLVSILLNE